jgi:hypothetical protein
MLADYVAAPCFVFFERPSSDDDARSSSLLMSTVSDVRSCSMFFLINVGRVCLMEVGVRAASVLTLGESQYSCSNSGG